MNTYSDIRTWLETTVRNEYFFRNFSQELRSNYKGFWSAQKVLYTTLVRFDDSRRMSREDYLEWVSLWKATYAKLSYESRMCKRHRKQEFDSAATCVFQVHMLRSAAETMLSIRKWSKELAAEAYARERVEEAA
jgi:hypothetical protein